MKLSGFDSSSIGTLFSSMGSSAGTDLLGINYSDYATIKSGTYSKLMKSYYSMDSHKSSKNKSSDTSVGRTKQKTSSATSKDSAKTLANIEEAAENLTGTATELYTRAGNKVFAKDSSGKYDTDRIYGKVSKFVDNYNSLLKNAGKSDVSRIGHSLTAMKNTSTRNQSSLSAVGISVDSKSGELSIDKDSFLKADMSKVQALFQGTGSYAYNVATQASMIDSYAQTEASKANTYGNAGAYNYNYNSGSIFADYF